MPLTIVGVGETHTIKRISGSEEQHRHLENLGFVVGAEVTVVAKVDQDVIVNIKEARVAIGRELAGKIFV